MLTRDLVEQLVKYDPSTGSLTWKVRSPKFFKSQRDCNVWNSRFAGAKALASLDSDGYMTGAIMGKSCKAHQVVWLLETGVWPERLDHKDRDPTNNRLGNLREVTQSVNCRNMSLSVRNTSGVKGVSRHIDGVRWRAKIMIGGKSVHLGLFEDFEQAVAVRRQAEAANGYLPA